MRLLWMRSLRARTSVAATIASPDAIAAQNSDVISGEADAKKPATGTT